MREVVNVPLPGREYDILIGTDVLNSCGTEIKPFLKRPFVAIVTDETVAVHHLPQLQSALSAEGINAPVLQLPAGEATKSWAQLQTVVEWLLEQKVERDDVVIAFGGGVIGDLVGFAAAILRRGVQFVQIPTTLLAQVDSSVGGKTGINSPQGKNLVGAFHQPIRVMADIGCLDTLANRDFLAGFGEVVKYGLLGDEPFFEWLEKNGPNLAKGSHELRIEAVRRSCQSKADIVVRDEKERGDRALLNLGHTFGHALESATGYSDRLLHGEGVSIGCALAFETSMRLGLCSQEAPSRVREFTRKMGMKTDIRDITGDLPDADGLLALMAQDKKVQQGQIGFILADKIGHTFVSRDVDLNIVRDVLTEALKGRN